MKEIKSIANISGEPVRMNIYLKSAMKLSSSLLTKVKFGGVFLNGKNVTMRATVSDGDEVLVLLPDEKNDTIQPKKLEIEILYEDDNIVVVNKPKNTPSHPSRGNHLPTLAEGLVARYGEGFIPRIITRLDRDTSGIVLIAKDQFSA